jgi:ATP-binding cassette, subfamily B, bacterial
VLLRDLGATLRLFFQASPGHALVIVASSIVQSLVPAATLWVSKLLLDAVAEAVQGRLEGGFNALASLLALQVGIGVLGTLLGALQSASRDLLGDRLQNRIHRQILEKASKLELERFENPETYDAMLNATAEVGTRPLGVATQLIGLGQAVIVLLSIGALLAQLGWVVVPLVLLAVIPGVIVSNRFGFENYRMIRRRAPDARAQNYLSQVLLLEDYVKEVRIFGFEPYLLERWQAYYLKFRSQLVPMIVNRGVWSVVASLVSAGLLAVATLQVLARAAQGLITVGDFSLFVGGIAQVQAQFSTLLAGFSGIYQSLLYMHNLFEFLELPARDLDAGEEWTDSIDTIEFQDVAFRYPLTTRDVLNGVNFKITKGNALALVGENGAGKTTVVKLLTRLYEPTSGRILLNGLEASRFSPRSVQKQMSIIFQDYGRYQMTARENIAMSDLSGLQDEAALEKAGARAGANEFVSELPKGLDTMLGRMFEGGRQLSGGQWQRLALSRLYFRDASVIVFDEPTAALDAQAEFEAIQALREQVHDRIAVLISHRFSTVRLADHIVVLEEGRVSEAGSHEALLAASGTYSSLFRLQARGYQLEERLRA